MGATIDNLTVLDSAVFRGQVYLPAGVIGTESVKATGLGYTALQQLVPLTYRQNRRPVKQRAKTEWFNLDNGAGTTVDDCVLNTAEAITITSAKAVYVDATTGTVAGANFKLGTTLGAGDIVAATAYENAKAVGTTTAGTVLSGAVAAAGSVFVRHTGIAATAAGQAFVEIEYTLDADANREVYAETVPMHIAFGAEGSVVSIEVMLQDGIPTSTRAHTIDLQYGTPGSGYATVLTAPITLDSSSVLRTDQTTTLLTLPTEYIDGGSFRLVIASTGSGTNGKGLVVCVRVAEDAEA